MAGATTPAARLLASAKISATRHSDYTASKALDGQGHERDVNRGGCGSLNLPSVVAEHCS